jgi:hypothetical protein
MSFPLPRTLNLNLDRVIRFRAWHSGAMTDIESALIRERTAARLCRGARRLLWTLGYASVVEFPLANGRRADILAVAGGGEIVIVEVKSSIVDFRTDLKWPEYLPYCDAFYFAVGDDFPRALIPESCGLIVADGFGAAILRASPVERLVAARRKSLLATFGQIAASRLHRLEDPMRGSG